MNAIALSLLSRGQQPPWDDVDPAKVVHLGEGSVWRACVIEGGMQSGLPSIALRLDLPDGTTVVAETSLENWSTVTIAARAKYPDAFSGGPLDPDAPRPHPN